MTLPHTRSGLVPPPVVSPSPSVACPKYGTKPTVNGVDVALTPPTDATSVNEPVRLTDRSENVAVPLRLVNLVVVPDNTAPTVLLPSDKVTVAFAIGSSKLSTTTTCTGGEITWPAREFAGCVPNPTEGGVAIATAKVPAVCCGGCAVSAKVTLKLYVPTVVGVPLSNPFAPRLRPGGTAPLLTTKL